MKKNLVFITAVLLIVLGLSAGLLFTGCGDDDDGLNTLLEIAQDTDDLNSLVNVISYIDTYSSLDPGVAGSLDDSDETITVFGPQNAAFVAVFGDNDLV